MSDISDVLNIVASQCVSCVYPNGTAQPSVTGKKIRVYPGWPTSSSLDQDLQAGNTNVSIFPAGPERNTTRYRPQAKVMSITQATITLTAENGTLVVGGAMPAPFTAHNVAALIGGRAFIYAVQAGDTLISIATGLTALIAASYPGTSNTGAIITLPEGVNASVARVGTTGQVTTEWERQIQRIQITIWAPEPNDRNEVGSAIKSGFSQFSSLTMPDGFGAWIKSMGQIPTLSDLLEKAKTYRRDLFYDVEYATTVTKTVATVVATKLQFQDTQGDPIATRTY